ncbi:unnamed protein product [Aspergillus oryzae]|nr:unnamed protein product [Aspergillus oryzae]GMF96054.1 unnamed protein product [Aspergillus oryzae]GMG11890.1 unnamed protein product [Aspergillus oryzae]
MYFSRSGTPSTDVDTSFFANLDIKGYVAADGRGTVSGTASGADSSFKWVVHCFTSPAMKPGDYTMVYYQGEYKVAETSVSVTAGSSTSKDISGSVETGDTIFKIGDWDGTYVSYSNPC